MNANYIDIAIAIFLIYGTFKGLYKGLIIELASLLALILGIYISVNFSSLVGSQLQKHFSMDEKYVSIVSFAITFICIVIGVFSLGKILNKIANMLALGIVNKILGAVFGLIKTIFIIGTILFVFDIFNHKSNMVDKKTLNKSILYKPILNFSSVLLVKIDRSKMGI